ncbi:MAG: polyprenyl synthetase family protein [Acidobacteria bacterium]|jgi:geranylgeranyl diphosphate synthase type II|nr:polyprenyl synthetase family protein [Acidobacteriota bacterium]
MCSELQHEVIRLRERVNERLGELVPPEDAPPEQLHKAIRYSLVAPGKRIRPLMTLLTATRLGGDVEVGLDPACAVEMIHTASLIVDDMPFMDDAEMRRGRPANHRVFGQDVAALAAFDLVSRAFGTLAGARGLDDTQRTELVRLLSEALAGEGVIAGQLHDLQSEEREPDPERLKKMYEQKTGALFVASSEAGARIARVPPEWIVPIRDFAMNMGLLFQIVDDLLDRFGTLESIGKDVGQDDGKTTLVSVLGPEEARAEACHRLEAAERALDPLGPAGRPLDEMARSLLGPGMAATLRG